MPSTITRTRFERQAERLRQLVPHAGGELGRHVDGQPVGAPIGDDRVRLQAAMGLHLGAILALDDDVGLREALRHVAAAVGRRPAHVAVERQAGGGGKSRRHGPRAPKRSS